MNLIVPPDQSPHVQRILSGVEYDAHCNFSTPPRILDIGANIGIFAFWASCRYPGATVKCYEPVEDNLRFLRQNVADFGDKIEVVEKAVSADAPEPVKLYRGVANCGCWSRYNLGEQDMARFDFAETIHPLELPVCEMLKIDTEGCELEILTHYRHAPVVIVLEYHRASDRVAIDKLLTERGYWLHELQSHHHGQGVMKWRRLPNANN